jgi:hypothetical protein
MSEVRGLLNGWSRNRRILRITVAAECSAHDLCLDTEVIIRRADDDAPQVPPNAQKIIDRGEELYGEQFDHGDRNIAGRVRDLLNLAKAAMARPADERKPQVDAEVIERARKLLADLSAFRGILANAPEVTDTLRDLLAAVEAAPADEGVCGALTSPWPASATDYPTDPDYPAQLWEECWEDLHSLMCECSEMSPDGMHHDCCIRPNLSKKTFVAWLCCYQVPLGEGNTPMEAVVALHEALTAAAKPSRPDPDEMAVEFLVAELHTAEGVEWLGPYETGGGWCVTVTVRDKLLGRSKLLGRYVSHDEVRALQAAVRALRKWQQQREDGGDDE